MKLLVLGVISLLALAGCRDTINVLPAPTPQVTDTKNTIEYRVTSNSSSVRIAYSFPTDGLTLITTVPPWDTSYSNSNNTLFLSVAATPVSYANNISVPFLSVQILVNGLIFREATSSDFLLGTLSVSGTWRK